MERDCNVAYGLLYIALCHQGMKEGWMRRGGQSGGGPVELIELEYSWGELKITEMVDNGGAKSQEGQRTR